VVILFANRAFLSRIFVNKGQSQEVNEMEIKIKFSGMTVTASLLIIWWLRLIFGGNITL